MSDSKLKIGDVVMLNSVKESNGPLMTVVTVVTVTKSEELLDPSRSPMGFASVAWLDDNAQLHQASFAQECLTLI